MKLTFETGVGTVTGANFLFCLDDQSTKILVDCGLVQGDKDAMAQNSKPFPYEPSSIKYLFVTHAHLDHVGRIPKLVKDGFKGVIYSTPETKAIAEHILEDAVGILDKEAREQGILPLYERINVHQAISMWKAIPYHVETEFNEGFSVYLRDAGHILGSSMIKFTVTDSEMGAKKTIVFTGDLGNTPTPLLRDTEIVDDADYMVMESVYGDRNHEPREERKIKLENVIRDTIKRGGTVVIPAFSVERTQVLLYELNDLVENKKIPLVPVFVDSPLATKVTHIYKASTQLFNQKTQERIQGGDDVFTFPKLAFTEEPTASRSIDHSHGPKIILAGSGMSMGGRVTHHETLYLPDEKSTILLVGYQPLGTIGRRLLDGEKKLEINHEKIKVKAHIESIFGYSAHKDSDNLVEFVGPSSKRLKKVFVVMGEPRASMFLAQRLKDTYGVDAIHPEEGSEWEL
jgi:metallo-beta-lactamase family protein